MLMQVRELSKYFGDWAVLADINLLVNQGDRIGLVGRNGAGKTTLLRVLAGLAPYDQGSIDRQPDLTIGYLRQDLDFGGGHTLYAEMLSTFPAITALEQKLTEAENLLAAEGHQDTPALRQALRDYGRARDEYEHLGGYEFRAKVRNVLSGLGFSEHDFDRPVDQFSGGEKMRANLGKLLLQEPDLLLLDEPNNHLDLTTLEWLEAYLQKWKKAMLVISHDRYFLDNLVSSIWELEYSHLTRYPGNYTAYVQAKGIRQQQEEKQRQIQQDKIDRLSGFINRFRAKATKARQAKSKEKVLERMEPVTVTRADKRRIKVDFTQRRTSDREVLAVRGLAKRYGERVVFRDLDLTVQRGERVGILGPNGVGKTTLLQVLMGEDLDYQGEVKLGSRVSIGYFSQDLSRLNEAHTVLQELMSAGSFTEGEARQILGWFLFTGEAVFKPVQLLSGGERNRLALAKLVTCRANLLVLDEPTNHLDIDSREVLEAALVGYPGTVLFVSHDRYFLDAVATRIAILTPTGFEMYAGGYRYYREKRLEKETGRRGSEESRPASKAEPKKQRAQWAKRLSELEAAILTLEERKAELEDLLASASLYADAEEAKRTVQEYRALPAELEARYREWVEWSTAEPAGLE